MLKIRSIMISVVAIALTFAVVIERSAEALVPGGAVLVSVNNTGDGQGGNDDSPFSTGGWENMQISADGRYVVFNSKASNLVSGDTNNVSDVFVRDLVSNTTVRVSTSSSGVQTNARVNNYGGVQQAISSTGRYVAFVSEATNLIDGQTINAPQIYLKDTITGATSVVTQKANGTLGNGVIVQLGGVSSDGRFVLWQGEKNPNLDPDSTPSIGGGHVYLADLKDRTFKQFNQGIPWGTSLTPYMQGGSLSMSCDGSFVAMSTNSSMESTDSDTSYDIYLVDIRNGVTTTNITKASNSIYSSVLPELSCNGNYLTFRTSDDAFSPLVTAGTDHMYLFDRIQNSISLVDTSSSGVLNNGNATTGTSDDQGNVVFIANGTNLMGGASPSGAHLYLKHRDTGMSELLSKNSSGSPATRPPVNGTPTISANGKTVTAIGQSLPSDLISSDTNGKKDILALQTGL